MPITNEARNEVERLVRLGRRLEAIKYLCDTFQISLPEGKTLVDTLEKELASKDASRVQPPASSSVLEGSLRQEVIALLQMRKKIEAIKAVHHALRVGLKQAMLLVEQVEKEVNPNYRSVDVKPGCLGNTFGIVGLIFTVIGAIFLVVAASQYYLQSKTIKNSEKITGRVIELLNHSNTSSGGTAPVIAYQWKGKNKLYYSNTYSSPPAYEMNEEVQLYVSRDTPGDVIVDTFTDRWLLITIFGGLGGFFALFGALLLFAARKF